MFSYIINIIKNVSMFVGYVKNSNFKEPLSENATLKYINMLHGPNHDKAKEKLIIHNLRLVAHIAKKYDNLGVLSDDLISVGTIGLIKAIDSYSNEKSTKLSSYLSRCIENEILMHIRANKKTLSTISLSDSLTNDEQSNEIKLEDILSSNNIDYASKVDLENQINQLFEYLKVLDEIELKILTLRYGLYNNKEYSQKQIGKMLNISRSYVSRIERKAINKLLYEFRKNND